MDTEKFGLESTAVDRFPSKEEIRSVFEAFVQGKEYKELRVLSNEQGLYCYEIEVTLENGEKLEYNFQKATYNYKDELLPANARFSASIHMTTYDADGIPVSGKCVANYLDGVWQYT